MTMLDGPDFSEITEHLYVGGRVEPDEWPILSALGVTVNVNLQAERQDRFLMRAAPEVSLWLPTIDWSGPSPDIIRTGARFIKTMIDDGRKVYVHCMMGVGRSPIIAAGYLITIGMSVDGALALLRAKRPIVNPNVSQVLQLREFEAHWRHENGGD